MADEQVGIGRIVHYVLAEGRNRGLCRPAIVVNTFTFSMAVGCANLVVFPDGPNDVAVIADTLPVMWQGSVLPAHHCKAERTWHWPRACATLPLPAAPAGFGDGLIGHNHVAGVSDPHNCHACRRLAVEFAQVTGQAKTP